MLRPHAALRGFRAHSRATFLQRTLLVAAATLAANASLPAWAALKPSVTTKSATDITTSGAKLNGTANPMGDATTAAFDYGTTTNLGSSVSAIPATLAASYSTASVNGAVSGLKCATKYYFRVRGANRMGTSQGTTLSFTTGACAPTSPPPTTTAPTATTLAASLVTQTSATFNGSVKPGSAAASVSFEAGFSTAYAGSIAATPASIAAGSTPASVSVAVSGLTCGTTYHYRLRAASSVGTATGSDQTVTTSACAAAAQPTPPKATAPTAVTNPATASATAATLSASVNANGASTSVSFEHGATTAYGATIAAAPATLDASAGNMSVSGALAGLACGTTYNYRVRATNSAGTTLGGNSSFATAACGATTPQPTPPSPPVSGKTYYLSTTGNNANDGLSETKPWQTFAKAWTVLQPGDALMVADGSYTGASPPSQKSGTADQAILVRASRAGGATLDRIGFAGNAYLTFVGFRVKGSANAIDIGSAGAGKTSHHLVFREIGFSCTPGTLNDNACFSLGDGTHHVLLEDSWGWGGGRYTVMCYGGPGGSPANLTCDNNTFRRLVLRQGPAKSSGGNPQASLALYYASSNVVENVIALDGLASSDTSNSAFYITGHEPPPDADNNRYFGVIALNNLGQGFYLDCAGAICNGTLVRDSVFWNNAEYGLIVAGGSGISRCDGVVVDHTTIGASEQGSGFENYACAGALLTNNAFVRNAGYGARQSPSGGSTTGHHNGYWANTSGTLQNFAVGSGDLTSNPAMSFITRVEAASPYKGKGSTGDIGANVLTRYQDGVLTAAPLWPWPNEARIKAEMCAETTGGFCAAASLTSYVWEYEGKAMPASF